MAGYSLQGPDEQDPNRPAQAAIATLEAHYIFKLKCPLDLGYTFNLLQDVDTSRTDLTNTIKAKVTVPLDSRFRIFGKLGLFANSSSMALSSYSGFNVSPGVMFTASEQNSFLSALFFESRTYDAATQQTPPKGLAKKPFSTVDSPLPHGQSTGYGALSFSYVRSILESLDFSVNYGVSVYSAGGGTPAVVSHKISAELALALEPL